MCPFGKLKAQPLTIMKMQNFIPSKKRKLKKNYNNTI